MLLEQLHQCPSFRAEGQVCKFEITKATGQKAIKAVCHRMAKVVAVTRAASDEIRGQHSWEQSLEAFVVPQWLESFTLQEGSFPDRSKGVDLEVSLLMKKATFSKNRGLSEDPMAFSKVMRAW